MRTAIQNSTEFSALTGQILIIRGAKSYKRVKKTFKKKLYNRFIKNHLERPRLWSEWVEKQSAVPQKPIYSIILFPIKTASWAFAHFQTNPMIIFFGCIFNYRYIVPSILTKNPPRWDSLATNLHCLALGGTVLRHTAGVFLAQWVPVGGTILGPLNWVQLSLRTKCWCYIMLHIVNIRIYIWLNIYLVGGFNPSGKY